MTKFIFEKHIYILAMEMASPGNWHRASCIIVSVHFCSLFTMSEPLHYTPHTHMFNGPFSRTTQVSRYQKDKTNLGFSEARDSEWQWHQLGHMQVSAPDRQPHLHPTTLFFTGRMPFLPPNQHRESTILFCFQWICIHRPRRKT